jgi:hypothetical protein
MKGGEYMTAEKQKSLEQFIASDILACQSSLAEAAFKQQFFSIDDIYNLYREFDGGLLSPNTCINCKNEFSCLDSETGECESCFEANQLPQEIFEWWLVSPWLGKKLQIEGVPVLDNEYGIWWGRTTTGQHIALDYIIQKVFDGVMSYTE